MALDFFSLFSCVFHIKRNKSAFVLWDFAKCKIKTNKWNIILFFIDRSTVDIFVFFPFLTRLIENILRVFFSQVYHTEFACLLKNNIPQIETTHI